MSAAHRLERGRVADDGSDAPLADAFIPNWSVFPIDRAGHVFDACDQTRQALTQMRAWNNGDESTLKADIAESLWSHLPLRSRHGRVDLVDSDSLARTVTVAWSEKQPERLKLCLWPADAPSVEADPMWRSILLNAARQRLVQNVA